MPYFVLFVLAGFSFLNSVVSCYYYNVYSQLAFTSFCTYISACLDNKGEELFREKTLLFHISGGTTDLLLCDEVKHIETLGTSSDLYAGQAVDRVGVKLGFGFPAGVEVSRLAAECDETIKPRSSVRGMECSLSGLENQCNALLTAGNPEPGVSLLFVVFLPPLARRL